MTQFNYTSGNPNNLTSGATANMTDVKGPFDDLKTFLNSRTLNEDNLPVSMLQKLGLGDSSGQKGRGKSIITQTESRSNVAFGTLTTPDQVAGIVVPTDGLIAVAFQGTWQESVNGAAEAAIFVDGTIASIPQLGTAAPVGAAAVCFGAAATDTPLSTGPGGLMGIAGTSATAYTGDVTTGQIIGNASFEAAIAGSTGAPAANAPIGGPCYLFVAAGTHTISIQFRASSGSVTAKNRKLWVWTIGF